MLTDPPRFLDAICLRLDICLDLRSRSRISITRHRDADELEAAVWRGTGREPHEVPHRKRDELMVVIREFWEEER